MDTKHWARQLTGVRKDIKRVVVVSSTEVVAELGDGLAIAAIERSAPHFHLEAREVYTVNWGRLAVIVAGKVHVLKAGGRPPDNVLEVYPLTVHHAISLGSEPAIVEVMSDPPWSADDHILA